MKNEFFNSSDELLKEAQQILNEKPDACAIKKGQDLMQLGFRNTPEAIKSSETVDRVRMTEKTVRMIQDYSLRYLNNKFITPEQVEIICKKYNLYCGEVGLYKGFVPAKNLEQIKAFEKEGLKPEDMTYQRRYDSSMHFHWSEISYETFLKKKDNDRHTYSGPNKERLQICAPLKDMDVSRSRIEGRMIKDIPDPVVLQPVKGGYLIITAWGDEASDELVVNQKMN